MGTDVAHESHVSCTIALDKRHYDGDRCESGSRLQVLQESGVLKILENFASTHLTQSADDGAQQKPRSQPNFEELRRAADVLVGAAASLASRDCESSGRGCSSSSSLEIALKSLTEALSITQLEQPLIAGKSKSDTVHDDQHSKRHELNTAAEQAFDDLTDGCTLRVADDECVPESSGERESPFSTVATLADRDEPMMATVDVPFRRDSAARWMRQALGRCMRRTLRCAFSEWATFPHSAEQTSVTMSSTMPSVVGGCATTERHDIAQIEKPLCRRVPASTEYLAKRQASAPMEGTDATGNECVHSSFATRARLLAEFESSFGIRLDNLDLLAGDSEQGLNASSEFLSALRARLAEEELPQRHWGPPPKQTASAVPEAHQDHRGGSPFPYKGYIETHSGLDPSSLSPAFWADTLRHPSGQDVAVLSREEKLQRLRLVLKKLEPAFPSSSKDRNVALTEHLHAKMMELAARSEEVARCSREAIEPTISAPRRAPAQRCPVPPTRHPSPPRHKSPPARCAAQHVRGMSPTPRCTSPSPFPAPVREQAGSKERDVPSGCAVPKQQPGPPRCAATQKQTTAGYVKSASAFRHCEIGSAWCPLPPAKNPLQQQQGLSERSRPEPRKKASQTRSDHQERLLPKGCNRQRFGVALWEVPDWRK
eukprot:gnl/TRDRNA2_/TRDRNA2_177611_c2_seq1.p1 gnl/TRDRNA2_/TRDRNA2_177611_c2~~gnl/TRDRNA2_/TRDRNA2_177611_c2_seq1.p1  ORF type:complete len:656 (+),score=99.26 gnl/TRDRNA2_/TRDRNA2_177611_c2_seq1:81-2048(+)